MDSQTLRQTLEGMMIVGTDRGCGKTIVTAGLAAAIREAGFRVQALKPLSFCQESAIQRDPDQPFINKISQQYIQADTICAPSPWEVTIPTWNRIMEQCKNFQYPALIEAPGQVATPWQISAHKITDSLDICCQLDLSLLLVAQAGPDCLEKTRSALSFIQNRDLGPVGIICVETSPLDSQWEERTFSEMLLLSQSYETPYLGTLPHSPSISVSSLQQGNLLRLTQENIDLLPLQIGIGLKI